jgi:biotin carboxyl carrier protein
VKRQLVVDGRAAGLRIDGSSARYAPEDGEVIERAFTISALEPGAYLVTLAGHAYRVALGDAGEAAVNGRVLAIDVFDPRDRRSAPGAAAGGGRREVVAPMPGKVVRLLVAEGDAVEEGQGLVVVEAMKMQNEMKSPKAGRVAEVRAGAEAAVAAGQVLVVIE